MIGGGPSLPAAMKAAPSIEHAIYLSANAHGVKYWPCDYIVMLDDNEAWLTPYGVPIASTLRTGTLRLYHQRFHQSGMMAAYLAWVLGCSPILLAGIDCYTGDTYHDDPRAKSSGCSVRPEEHLRRWREVRAWLDGADVRALAGPLLEHGIFPPHDPTAPAGPPAAAHDLFVDVGGKVVTFTGTAELRPFRFQPGDTVELCDNELRYLAPYRVIRMIGDVQRDPAVRLLAQPLRLPA